MSLFLLGFGSGILTLIGILWKYAIGWRRDFNQRADLIDERIADITQTYAVYVQLGDDEAASQYYLEAKHLIGYLQGFEDRQIFANPKRQDELHMNFREVEK
jgi:hypothetical protein